MGTLEQASLPDIVPSYSLPMRDDPGVPQLHHPQGLQQQQQQQPLPPATGYGDMGEQSRYHLPFPWMKTTKSHSHNWKGQWAGISFLDTVDLIEFTADYIESIHSACSTLVKSQSEQVSLSAACNDIMFPTI